MNKKVNFISIPSSIKKKLDDFFRLIKLKAHFKENNTYNPTTEDQFFNPKPNKKWASDKKSFRSSFPKVLPKVFKV